MLYRIRDLQLIKFELLNFKKKYFGEIVWVLIGQVSIIILSVFSIKILTTMPKEEYGKYNLVLALTGLLSSILYGPAEQGFARYYFEFKKAGLVNQFFNLFIKFLMYAGLFTGLLLCMIYLTNIFFLKNVSLSVDLNVISVVNVASFIVIASSNLMFNSLLNLLRKRKLNTLYSIGEKAVSLSFNTLVFFYATLNSQVVLLGVTLTTFCFLMVKLLKIRRLLTIQELRADESAVIDSKKLSRQMFKFCLPFLVWGITGWIQISSDKVIISNYLNISSLGLYSLLFSIATYLISTPINIINQFIQPVIYEKIIGSLNINENKLGYKLLNYALVLILLLIGFLCIFTFFYGNSLILFLSNKDYLYHINLLPLLCLGIGIFQLAQFYTTFGFIKNRPDIYLSSKIISGLLAVILNIYFINKFQLLGIAISLLLVSITYFVMIIFANKKIGIGLITKFPVL